jgi:hypothetical protein
MASLSIRKIPTIIPFITTISIIPTTPLAETTHGTLRSNPALTSLAVLTSAVTSGQIQAAQASVRSAQIVIATGYAIHPTRLIVTILIIFRLRSMQAAAVEVVVVEDVVLMAKSLMVP